MTLPQEEIDQFNEDNKLYSLLDQTRIGLQEKINSQVDVVVLSDLKRMAELGVLEIQQTQPEFNSWDGKDSSIKATFECRLYFKGEDTIKAQKEEIDQLKSLLENAAPIWKEDSERYEEWYKQQQILIKDKN